MMKVVSALAAILLSVTVVYFINDKLMHPMPAVEKINLTASDSVKISADFYNIPEPNGWLLLIHMMPATKESWDGFAKSMQELGYASLAIDLRGHGESEDGPDGYQKFGDAEHRSSIQDLEAGWEFLKSKGAIPEKSAVIGASIGANLGLQFLTMHSEITGGVLLSPGNYKGMNSAQLVKKLSENQKIIFVASKLDERSAGNNAVQNREYYDLAFQVKNRHLIIFDGSGHGTDLFFLEKEYNLTEAIKKFLESGRIN